MLDLNQFEVPVDSIKSVSLTHIEVNQQFLDFRRLIDTSYSKQFSFGKKLAQSIDSVVAFCNYPARMTLPHHLNHLTFHFSAIDWAGPHKIEYQYFLEGQDTKWSNPSREPLADYRNLPHGSYTFKVRSRGKAQKWSEPFEYKLTIRPPWWQTWWAYSLYLLLFLAIVYTIYTFLKKRLLLENELKREQEESIRLKELDRFKSRLYTNLTHEFRTPLTIILGMTNQIYDDPQRHLKEGLVLIRNNGQQLLRLINQLLDLSKLESKSFQLHLQQGDVVSYLRYVTDSFYSFANSENLSLQFFTNTKQLVMDFDPKQIKQIMINLLSNAIKFTPSGGSIKVQVDQKDDCLNIKVIDTGIGISKEEQQRIFDRFYQIDTTTTRKGGGTGIGLAHTQELVKLMGGKITVKSKIRKGTSFQITLPIQKDAETSVLSSRGEAEKAAELEFLGATPDLAKEDSNIPSKSTAASLPHLLIIEDNPDVVTYLKSCLDGNYQMDVAYNGKVGVEKARENVPDLIISDVMMPEKDGLEVCDILKNDELTSHIPIILLTAKADIDSRISGLKTGADAYLSKPFDKRELLVRLEMMVEKQKKLLAYFTKKFQNGFVHSKATVDPEKEATTEDAFIERVREIVEENYAEESFALPQLCQQIGMSRSQLYRKMKALIDISPSDFIRSYRLEKARFLLENSDKNVSEVAYQTGYKDLAHFSKSFQEKFGHPPSATK